MQTIEGIIEQETTARNVTPIAARSFGSRMMNLHSDSSDYDILLLFAQEPEEYVQVGGYKDTFSSSYNTTDIQSWNIKKFAELLNNSNPTAIEFLQSPVEYYVNEEYGHWLDILYDMASESFQPIAMYYHYHSLAKDNYEKYIEESVYDSTGTRYKILESYKHDEYYIEGNGIKQYITIDSNSEFERSTTKQTAKRYVYILRALLYAEYIKKTGMLPNINFPEFTEEVSLTNLGMSTEQEESVRRLVSMKKDGKASAIVEDAPRGYIERKLQDEPDHDEFENRQMDYKTINQFIKSVIN